MVDKLKQSVTLSSSSQQQLQQASVQCGGAGLPCTGPGHHGLLPCGLGWAVAGEKSRAQTELPLKDNNNYNSQLRAMSLEQD